MLPLYALQRALAIEGLIVALCFLALIAFRSRVEFRKREVDAAVIALEPVLHAWLVCNADIATVATTLRGMRAHAAFRSLARLATQQVTFERQQALARALRRERWVDTILRQAR